MIGHLHPNENSHSLSSQTSERMTSPWRVFSAGVVYFAFVFTVGFGLGVVRVLWVVPRLGERLAELGEMPLMLGVSFLADLWVVRRFEIPPVLLSRLGVGLVGLGCLLTAEFGLVLPLRGLSLGDYILSRDPISGSAYYITLCLFAVMPWLVSPKNSTDRD